MITIQDVAKDTCSLHFGTTCGLGAAIDLDQLVANGPLQVPQWHKVAEDLLEQFDLNHDLEGQTVARIWGLASHDGFSAVLLSRHPTDMVEYQVASSEATTIGFAIEGPEFTTDLHTLHQIDSEVTEPSQWESAIRFMLSGNQRGCEVDLENQKLIYATACRAILGSDNDLIRAQARRTFEHLADLTGADLSEEIENCSVKWPQISAKSAECFSQPGAHLYEWCEICDAAIAWSSAKEAQCANGHLFSRNPVSVEDYIMLILYLARCALSSLAIQQPAISKWCSVCRAEYMDEELVASTSFINIGTMFSLLSSAFDTCLICKGKFQIHI